MRLYLLVAYVLMAVSASTTTPSPNEEWEAWKTMYGKTYSSKKIESLRQEIWLNNLKKIKNHNNEQENSTFTMVMNSFGDLTEKEFAESSLIYPSKEMPVNNETGEAQVRTKSRNAGRLPLSVDWRKAGYVTQPKYQGRCGSCWAFTATGVLEGQLFKKTRKLISLSEQNLVDCTRHYGSSGCNGGWPLSAFKYIKKSGIEASSTYPYTGKAKSSCKFSKSKSVTSIKEYKVLPSGDEEVLTRAVAEVGPISVLIDAELKSWQFYNAGVHFDSNCRSNTFSHAVLVVGYGSTNGTDYYIVKNSWGQSWGQSGYILMSRGRNNHCGIASFAMFALI
ncbi:cathepsin K-like [Rhinoraja longicauda]